MKKIIQVEAEGEQLEALKTFLETNNFSTFSEKSAASQKKQSQKLKIIITSAVGTMLILAILSGLALQEAKTQEEEAKTATQKYILQKELADRLRDSLFLKEDNLTPSDSIH